MSALQLDTRSAARLLQGEYAGRNKILAPGPGHSRQDRSLSVTLSSDVPDGFIVNSFAGDDPMQCRDHVRALLGLPAWFPGSGGQLAPTFVPRQEMAEERRQAAWKAKRVQEQWDGAQNPRGTVVERYLASRGLDLPADVAGSAIRFHPICPWKHEGRVIEVPAMIAAMRCIHTDRLKAVHRTWLTPDGRKLDRRMFGDATEVAIKLDPDEAVTMGLVVGEGIETVLSARKLGLRPAWALGSAGSIGTFPLLSGVEALTVLTEEDKTGANARAVDACGTRWHGAGRSVFMVASKFGGDINDAVQRRAGQ